MTEWQIGLIVTIILGIAKFVHGHLNSNKQAREKLHQRIDDQAERIDKLESTITKHLIIHKERGWTSGGL